jgi:hypothetical protein
MRDVGETKMAGKLTGPTRGPALPEEAKSALRAYWVANDLFRAIRPEMPVQYVTSFVAVALEEGKGVNYYANKVGVSKSVMSRHLHDISDADRLGKEGYGLVEHCPHPTELRSVEIYLTPDGRALANRLFRAWQLRGNT